jgi:very-short-patch-repair endonuclease
MLNTNYCFAMHPRSKFWSSKNKILPSQVFEGDGTFYWFDCSICKHDFQQKISDVRRNRWCGFCAGKKFCDLSDCLVCFNKSFASHEKSKYLSPTVQIPATKIFLSSNNYYDFDCATCGHTFNSLIKNITNDKNPTWCPYCSIPCKRMCDKPNCNWCFVKSFESHPKAQFWSVELNGGVLPRQVIMGSNKKFYFICGDCNSLIQQTPNAINCENRWCNICTNKTEKKLFLVLKEIYKNVIKEFRAEWCKNIKPLPFDFCIPEYKIIIELDGRQHFFQVSDWKSPEDQLKTDLFKMQKANENSYSVIRIIQEDVLHDIYDWKNELVNNINTIIATKETINNIFMCKNCEYDEFDKRR